jgi:ribosomal protein S18 acetylase RimI-like enzyme
MNIRKYNTGDYQTILDIYAACKLDELRYEDTQFALLPLDKDLKRHGELFESDIFLFEDDGIVGYCAHFGAEIRALFIHPNNRGMGIGKCLLEFLLAKIPGPVELYVAKSNTPAKNLYRQFGFLVVDEFATSYNGVPVLANKMVRFA